MELKVLELFGGIGAPRAALKRLGLPFKIMDYVEIDKFAVASYNAMFEENYEPQDITKWDKDLDVDLIFHGSPCQDFSNAGLGAGGEKGSDTRSSLMWHTVRIVEKLQPRVVIWENVKGVLNKRHKPTFDKYIEKLQELGYISYAQVLNAKSYGVPQNRERVFVISIRGEHMMYQFPQPQELTLKLKDILEPEVDERYYISEKLYNYLTDMTDRNGFIRGKRFKPHNIDDAEYAYAITTNAGNRPTDNFIKVKNATKKGYLEAYEGDGVDLAYPNSKLRRGRVQTNISQTITADDSKAVVVAKEQYGRMGKQAAETVNELDVKEHNTINPFNKKISSDDNISPTVTTRPEDFKTAIILYEKLRIRKLTPKECWRLMDFDDEYFEKADKVNSNTQLYKQAGNSIVVNVLYEILWELQFVI